MIGIGIAFLCIGGLIRVCPFSLKVSSRDIDKEMMVMTELEKRDYKNIDTKIQEINETFKEESLNTKPYSVRFKDAMIMGDSMAEGIIEYGLVSEKNVVAERGKRTDNIDDEIRQVIRYEPKIIFMVYGLNDLEYCRGNAQRFVNQYKIQIEKIQKALPHTRIYINSITPIDQVAQSKNKAYTKVSSFNTALMKLCKEMNIVYIDTTKLIDFSKDVYEKDGIHPLYPYYPVWLTHMLEVAGL